MSQFLILNHHHYLTPIAHRLKQEGHDVVLAPFRRRYERAWKGVLDEHVFAVKSQDRAKVAEFAAEQDTVVLTDSGVWADELSNLELGDRIWKHLPEVGESLPIPTAARIGAWWDGAKFSAPHLLVSDWGAWSSGLGPIKEGGLTLVNPLHWPAPFMEMLEEAAPHLEGFRGLVQVTMVMEPQDGSLRFVNVKGGWHPLHMHAFLLALGTEDPISKLLLGEAQPTFVHRYSLVVALTLPPWPSEGTSQVRPIGGLTEEQMGAFFWHDVALGEEGLQTAGLDGFVGVAKGTGPSVELAQQMATTNLWAVQLEEKQFRADAGGSVRVVTGGLGDAGFFI